VVVFGGGSPYTSGIGPTCSLGAPAGVAIEVASTGGLGLAPSGDSVSIFESTTLLTSVTFGAAGANEQSLTRDPQLSVAPLALHLTVAGATTAFSPGLRADLSPL